MLQIPPLDDWTPLIVEAIKCHNGGMSPDVCFRYVKVLNDQRPMPLDDGTLRSIVRATRISPEYRKAHHRLMELEKKAIAVVNATIDAELDRELAILFPDGTPEDRRYMHDAICAALKYQRKLKRLTFTGWLASGTDIAMPEKIGRWCTYRGRLTLLAGREKYSGKSTLATAEVMFALEHGLKALWVSHDEKAADIVARFADFGAGVHGDRLMIAADLEAPYSWKELYELVTTSGANLCVLDSLDSVLNGVGRERPLDGDHVGWNAISTDLRKMANEADVGLNIIHHAKKVRKDGKRGGYIGSIGIAAGVDFIAFLNGDEDTKITERMVTVIGRRIPATEIRVTYVAATRTYIDNDNPFGDQDATPQENLTRKFIRDTLTDGPVRAGMVIAKGGERGFGRTALQDEAKAMGIVKRGGVWSLPTPPNASDAINKINDTKGNNDE
jgi:hypothetical protein